MQRTINISDFDLAATLECGQAFRWRRMENCWFMGIIGHRVARLRQHPGSVEWELYPDGDAKFIQHYLAVEVSLPEIIATFPNDALLHEAVKTHHGLRVLRQEPWECLASFIASSSKQIVQIRQIVALLAERFGEPIETSIGTFRAFPGVSAIARASHQELWDCKLGFRAKHLLAAARMIDSGKIDLDSLRTMEHDHALEELMKLPGVGEKIAGCSLLFSCGFDQAFPIDVWIERALKRIYFPDRKRFTHRELREFTRSHFGPYAGWAQQYLFLQERLRPRVKRS